MAWDSDRHRPLAVGALFSATGPTAFVERTQWNAMLLAIEEINAAGGVAGREVVAVVDDARSDPAQFSRLAERMLDDDHASLLIGCYMTNTRQAVVPVVERRGALLAYAAPYEGFEYSPNVIYGGAVPNQHILLLARHLITSVGKRFYLVGTRYTFPIESNRVMMTLVAEQKGQVLAERYVRLDAQTRELKAIVDDIKAKRPDVVFCTVVGEAARLFYELCRDADIGAQTQVASLTITEAELALMSPGLAEGHLTAATYFESIATPANRRFVRSYKARFGAHEHTNAMAETAYGLTHMVLAAAGRLRIRRCGNHPRGAFKDGLRGSAGTGTSRCRQQPFLSLAAHRTGRIQRSVRRDRTKPGCDQTRSIPHQSHPRRLGSRDRDRRPRRLGLGTVLKSLRDIRNVRVLILHPKDRECDELVAQIRRIGCRVEAVWPPQGDIASDTDIVFVLFRQDAISTALAKALAEHGPGLTLIGIVEFESPAVIETVVRAGTSAIITKPIRAFGLLTSIIVAHTISDRNRLASERIGKLESRLSGLKQIEKAKSILMARNRVSEQEAYDALRMRAMSKRMTMEAVCAAIIEASEVFGD